MVSHKGEFLWGGGSRAISLELSAMVTIVSINVDSRSSLRERYF